MRSPVSIRALGECNAILSPGFGHSRLTFVGSFENQLRASQKPVSGWPTIRSESRPLGGIGRRDVFCSRAGPADE
jgi:hypothetical protein